MSESNPRPIEGATEQILSVARACHEMNRALCELLGDDSQKFWEVSPLWMKESAVAGVLAVHSGAVTSPIQSHSNWMKGMLADGWTHGETKDPEKKTHPCLVPFGDLPPEQQLKDHIFFHTASLLLKRQ